MSDVPIQRECFTVCTRESTLFVVTGVGDVLLSLENDSFNLFAAMLPKFYFWQTHQIP